VMTGRVFLLFALALGALGCSSSVEQRQAKVSVTGKVSHGGQPVGNVLVAFHPLDNGFLGTFPVKPDGSFGGELVAGNYSYYVTKAEAPNAEVALKNIDPKFLEPNMERKVSVAHGQGLLIALD
jgi:hypothetical protein